MIERISKEDWKQKILKELKGKKTLEDLRYQISNLGSIDILLQEEDRITNPDIYSFPQALKFGIQLKDPASNHQIIQSLKYGASVFMISGQKAIPWKAIMQGVHLQMVEIFTEQPFVLSKKKSQEIDSVQRIHKISKGQIIDVESSITDGSLFEKLYRFSSNDELKSVFLILDDSYLFNISLLRALRIILQQTKSEFTIGTISNFSENDEEYDLIRFTLQVQASQAGGSNCHFFEVKPHTPDHQITRMMHIHNILNMESNDGITVDPWKGAYVVEHITHYIFENIEKGGP